MQARILVCFPTEDLSGLRADAAQLALGLAAGGAEVMALGPMGAWRYALRRAQITATDCPLVGETRKLTGRIKEFEPHIIHAFGLGTARTVLPFALQVGASGVATLGHGDNERLLPTDFRTVSTLFVPCDQLREQVARRLPSASVITTGYLLPPAESVPATRKRFLAEELGLMENAPLVLLADRFQGQNAETAFRLLEAVPLLAERIPGLQVMLAGDGERLAELETRAAEVNDRLGARVVLLPGSRNDLEQILALATVAVGSGRFAMEAVGAGVALVAAGAAGMVGTYTEETASVAHFTCCGAHGRLEPVTARALAGEIVGLFAYPGHRQRFAEDGQAQVLAENERGRRAAQIATYYRQAAPTGALTRAPQRITVILPDDLRELLFTLPAVSALPRQYPLATLRLVTSSAHRRLVEQLGLTDTVLVKPTAWRDWPAFLREQWQRRADVCLAFAGGASSALLTVSGLAPQRLGFADDGGNLCYSDHLQTRLPISPARAMMLVNTLGISTAAPIPMPMLLPETREMINQSLLAAGVNYPDALILLCPQAEAERAWPDAYWLQLAEALLATRTERIAVFGAPHLPWPEGVVRVMPVQESLVLATLLARAEVVVSAESAPLHLANILGVPTVCLYGPTDPEQIYLPNPNSRTICHREYPCHPCATSPCPERHCLQALTPAEVADAVADLLAAPALV
ncbi:MAG TPA: glycosyltransferase family 9 protein [Armatimonadota bacterium]|jgi:ADP-heptose:LPS heptosyltransferase